MKRILVAVDGSAGASRAAHFAARLAHATGASIELVHVYDAPTASYLGLEALSRNELTQKSAEIGKGSFDAARAIIEDRAETTDHVAIGHPAEEIVYRAKDIDADLIVMGSRGLTPVERILLGSVSKRVLHLADRPVTIVPVR